MLVLRWIWSYIARLPGLLRTRSMTAIAGPSCFAAALMSLPAPVLGNNQVDIKLGDECIAVALTEAELGAEWLMDTPEQMHFQREYLGQPADIGYRCAAGRISRITYTFWFDQYEQAKHFYLDRKPALIQTYGAPSVDQGSPGYLDYMESIGFEIKDEHRYILLWQQPHKSITYGAHRQRPGDPRSWVSIDMTSNHHGH